MPLAIGAVGNSLSRSNVHVEGNARLTWRSHFDVVSPGLEIQMLELAVEVVNRADIVAIGIDSRVLRRARNSKPAIRFARVPPADITVRIAVTVAIRVAVSVAVITVGVITVRIAGIEAEAESRSTR